MHEIPAAFPSVCNADPGHPSSVPGMTLRDWFAGQVLSEAASKSHYHGLTAIEIGSPMHPKKAAEAAYRYADAMLAERSKASEPEAQPMQHVAYFDEGQFHWMSGVAPRKCELYARRAKAHP